MGHRPSIDHRIRRSRFLVIGITASLFICLTPETVFDISSYIFGVTLRKGVWEIFGIVWYIQTILNPVIYISSFPNLRSKAKDFFERLTDRVCGPCHVKTTCSKIIQKTKVKKMPKK